MTWDAACQCGAMTLSSAVAPAFSLVCGCTACQRRTGSAFSVNAYFPKDLVETSGREQTWSRATDSGRRLTNHFCPNCGTTLYWDFDMRPDHFGVASGCLKTSVDPPIRAVWTHRMPDWVTFPTGWPVHPGAAPTA